MKARALRYGRIPPAGGIERQGYLRAKGHSAGSLSIHWLEQSLAEVEAATGFKVPGWVLQPVTPSTEEGLEAAFQRSRPLVAALVVSGMLQASPDLHQTMPGERSARRSLDLAVQAFHWLAETDDANLADGHLHRVAPYVSLLFGCFHQWDPDDRCWYEVCQTRLAHTGLGQSVGFTTKMLCSICQDDPSECVHVGGVDYETHATRIGGRCNICGAEQCGHDEGHIHRTSARPMWGDPDLHEISVTATPRDPLARVTHLEIDPKIVRSIKPWGQWRCWRCACKCPDR